MARAGNEADALMTVATTYRLSERVSFYAFSQL